MAADSWNDSTLYDTDFFQTFDQSQRQDQEEPDPVLQFINQMLLEENMDGDPGMFHDPLAVQTIEKSFYDVLAKDSISPPFSPLIYSELSSDPPSISCPETSGFAEPNITSRIFRESDLLFRRGMEEGSKFLPAVTIGGDSAKYKTEFQNELRRRKHGRPDDDDGDDELNHPRSSKLYSTAASEQEDELSEKFDRVLLNHVPPEDLTLVSSRKNRARKTEMVNIEAPNLSTLVLSCAQSVAADDRKTAGEQLKLIKKHASPTGDPDQRLANLFANALEARLAGTTTTTEQYRALTPSWYWISAAEELKAYRVFHFTPSRAIPDIFGNQMILLKASKASTLHIIDFGIGSGFQWPSLIQHLSQRPNGPPKLRITGIEIPRPGFRPAEAVEEAGRRLAGYCKRFNVPFEYNAIATRSWETIRVEELKVSRGELLVVNSRIRFKHLLDETVAEENPRDAVLNLIRNLNPDMFLTIHANGLHSSPFFLTRFREAFFFYSAALDAVDNLLPRNDEQRLKYENMLGSEIMNLVACEGQSRVERPESYKQWQTRCMRAGFKLVPLRQDLMKELRNRVKKNYHKDFNFDEDGYWMLLGWKGKIFSVSSCWVPT